MKITVLVENLVYRKGLYAEHGLSLHIDTGSTKILFDTGQTDAFAENANALGINLAEVDYAVISHGHYDHTGGLKRFMNINSKAGIILSPYTLVSRYKGDKYIGIQPEIHIPENRICYVKDIFEIGKSVRVIGNIKTNNARDTHFTGFYKRHEGEMVPDIFTDELALIIESPEGIHLVSGCSHNGITNILEAAKSWYSKPVSSVIGGFHLVDSTQDQVEYITEILNSERVSNVYTGHCTGLENYGIIKKVSNALVKYMYTAYEILLN